MRDKTSSHARVYGMLAFVMLFWSGNSIAGRALRDDIGPFTLALLRWSLGLVILIPLAWTKIRQDGPAIRAGWQRIVLLGAIGVGSFNALLYSGLRSTPASNALLIQAAIPVLVLVFDWVLFRSRPLTARAIGVGVSAIGVLTIIFRADVSALLALSFGRGDALILCSVVAWSLYTALLRLRPAIHPLSFLTLTFVVGAMAMLPLAAVEWQSTTLRLTPKVVAAIAYVALLPSVVAYFLFNRAVAEIGAAAAGQTISLQPLIGALLASVLLGEELHAYHVAGMSLILIGIALPFVFRARSA